MLLLFIIIFLIFISFGASGSLCFVIVTFPGYLNLYLLKVYADSVFKLNDRSFQKNVPERWRLYHCL